MSSQYFIEIGKNCGLLPPNEPMIMAVLKNMAQSLSFIKPTKYHHMFILGYRDGLKMSAQEILDIIDDLERNRPINKEYRRNSEAQIAGFMFALEKHICDTARAII